MHYELAYSNGYFQAVVGDQGITARLGGDEFVVLLPDLQNEKQGGGAMWPGYSKE